MNTTGLNAGFQPQFAGAEGFATLADHSNPHTMLREGERPKLYPQSGRQATQGTSASQSSSKQGFGQKNGQSAPQPQQNTQQSSPTPPAGDWKEQILQFLLDHKRELSAVALLLSSVLMLLALVSYSPPDYTNAKISAAQSAPEQVAQPSSLAVRSRVGTLSTTLNAEPKPYIVQNWLGYAGACVAHFVYHYTVGYAGLLFPVLLAVWSLVLYKPSAFAAKRDRIMLATGLALMGAAIIASIIGVMQLIAWMPDFVSRPEWSGSVGQFIARMLWQLIGTVGALLLLAAALGAVVFTTIDLDIEKTILRAGREKSRLQSMAAAYRDTKKQTAASPKNESPKQHEQDTLSNDAAEPAFVQGQAQGQADVIFHDDISTIPNNQASNNQASSIQPPSNQTTSAFQECSEEPARFIHSQPNTVAASSGHTGTERDMASIRRELLAKYGDAFNDPNTFAAQTPSDTQPVRKGTHPVSPAAIAPEFLLSSHSTASNTPSVNVSAPHTHVDAAPFVYPANASITYVKASASQQESRWHDTRDARFFDEAATHQQASSPAFPQHTSPSEMMSHVQATAQAAAQVTAEAVAHATAQMTAFETAKIVAIEAARETAQIAAQEAIRAALHSGQGFLHTEHTTHTTHTQAEGYSPSGTPSGTPSVTPSGTQDSSNFKKSDDVDYFSIELPANIAATLAQAEVVKSRLNGDDSHLIAIDEPIPSTQVTNVQAASNLLLSDDDLPPIHIATPVVASTHVTQTAQPDAFAEAGKKAAQDLNSTLDEELNYVPPTLDLLVEQELTDEVNEAELRENARLLTEKLRTFRIEIENLTVTPGPVVTQYEFVPAAGIKVSQIEGLADDIALALKARGIRIMAPVPGRGTVAVEIPNHKPTMVRFSSIVDSDAFRDNRHRLPLALGKTISGEVFCADLAKMPHLLIAGSTGSGKSVGINTILASLLYKMHPRQLKFLIVDPKKIEMSQYRPLLKHFLAVCPDIDESIITNPHNAVIALKSVEAEMERRYDVLAKVGQRNIADYNQKVAEGRYKDTSDIVHREMPYIVVVIDELADLMMTAGREVEDPIIRLAQLARAVGIHLIVATQRPSVDVVTGLIKANFPARIAFQVASKVDSRTILDMSGAEHLLGNGDMLFTAGGAGKPLRVQNSFLSTEEVELVCEHISSQHGYSQAYMLPSVNAKSGKGGTGGDVNDRDEMFTEAAQLVVRHQQGSVSLLQRRLKIGYSRAARIMDQLEEMGVVGPFDGSKGRSVLMASEAELESVM